MHSLFRPRKYEEFLQYTDMAEHIHISKDAVVQEFIDNLKSSISEKNNFKLIEVTFSKNDRVHIFEKLAFEIQSERSLLNTLKSPSNPLLLFAVVFDAIPSLQLGQSIRALSRSYGDRTDASHARVNDAMVELDTDSEYIIFLHNHSGNLIEHYGWVHELNIPNNCTIVTHGYATIDAGSDDQEQIEVGRLDFKQTKQLVRSRLPNLNDQSIQEVYEAHSGNPFAIQQSIEYGEPTAIVPVEDVWGEVYESKVSPREDQLLQISAHFIDLHPSEISRISNSFSMADVKKILSSLEKKGVIIRSESGTFSTGKYLQKHYLESIGADELENKHKSAFKYYLSRWARLHNREMAQREAEGITNYEESEQTKQFLYLSLFHFYNIDKNMSKSKFKRIFSEIAGSEDHWEANQSVKPGNLFSFGVFAQRFVYNDAKKAMGDITEIIFGTTLTPEEALFEGLAASLAEDSLENILRELSKGWSDQDLRLGDIGSKSGYDRKNMFRKLHEKLDSKFLDALPASVRNVAIQFVLILALDHKQGREAYQNIGKTAEEHGLDEESFTDFTTQLLELFRLIKLDDFKETDRSLIDEFDSVDQSVRSRTEIASVLKQETQGEQKRFDNMLISLKNRQERIIQQIDQTGEALTGCENPIFPYAWYTIADEISRELFDSRSIDLYTKRVEQYKEREFWERDQNDVKLRAEKIRKLADDLEFDTDKTDK